MTADQSLARHERRSRSGLDQLQERFPALDLRRRDILKCLGATLALAGLDGCERSADEKAMPFVNNPDGGPGAEKHYATALELDGVGQPVIGICRDGRPVKLEGNPNHPASLGATDAFTQAALLGLYDPARSPTPLRLGAPATWAEAEGMLFDLSHQIDSWGGAGFRLLTGPIGSPTLLRQIGRLRARWPGMQWHVHAPLVGAVSSVVLPLEKAAAVVALDADPLGPGPLQTIHARGWSARRSGYQAGRGDASLFVAEPAPTLTGAIATRRLPARFGRIPALLAALSEKLGGDGAGEQLDPRELAWVEQAAEAIQANRGAALIVLGAHHPPALHQQVAQLNATLGAPVPEHLEANGEAADLPSLATAMRSGEVHALFVLDSNPVYSSAPELAFSDAMNKVPLRLHAGLHADETAGLAHWHLPLAHLLESWSDVRAANGSPGIVQPLVRPYLDVRSRHEILAMLTGDRTAGRVLVQQTWNTADGDRRWEDWLLAGRVEGSASATAPAPPLAMPRAVPDEQGLDLIFLPDPSVYDGQFANNPWLQELPRPFTKLTWDNAIHVGPALAARLGLENEQLAELSVGRATVSGPVWVIPGIAEETVVVHLGYGRRAGGAVGDGVGFDAYPLRSLSAPWRRTGAHLAALESRHRLATTQPHRTMAGHDFVKFVDDAGEGLKKPPAQANMYPPQRQTDGLAWAMAIDLDLCIGCNACVTACVAENNIPMVGKDEVAKGREMHWLRVDHYADGPPDDPQHVFQPVPCMHCENAPCEMGCPVNATVHSPDGLNLQVYNRCIGTRTCSAFCPYKVRHFNWFDYTRKDPPEVRAARNPEVTVRDRGVMEKCTYCIQRIEREKIDADAEGRAMGEVRTACQQACPTNAIVFGNIADGNSEVSRRKAGRRDYALLEEANTRPRTTYGARIRRGRA